VEPPARIDARELGQRALRDEARRIRGPLQALVVHQHRLAGGAGAQIELDAVQAVVERALESDQGVLRRLVRGAAVAHDPGRPADSLGGLVVRLIPLLVPFLVHAGARTVPGTQLAKHAPIPLIRSQLFRRLVGLFLLAFVRELRGTRGLGNHGGHGVRARRL